MQRREAIEITFVGEDDVVKFRSLLPLSLRESTSKVTVRLHQM